ncbi:MAG: hypothetical protein IJ635_10920 [Bacteroidaceae bacterium]|nr:hypothetical protein [Bacteroidaceae bacterium]
MRTRKTRNTAVRDDGHEGEEDIGKRHRTSLAEDIGHRFRKRRVKDWSEH